MLSSPLICLLLLVFKLHCFTTICLTEDYRTQIKNWLQALQEVEDDMYFFRNGDTKIGLSIYQPVKWGIAGTAQIAEDVVSCVLCLSLFHAVSAV